MQFILTVRRGISWEWQKVTSFFWVKQSNTVAAKFQSFAFSHYFFFVDVLPKNLLE